MSNEISSEYFNSLYIKETNEEVINLEDAPGITIIKPYPDSHTDKANHKMHIRFYLLDGLIFGGVNMVENKTQYIIQDKKATNFYIDSSDNITFNPEIQRFIVKRWWGWHKEFTIKHFVNLLVKNHLSGKPLGVKIKDQLLRLLKIGFLKTVFWSLDSQYNLGDYLTILLKTPQSKSSRSNEVIDIISINKSPEPFFKYFGLYKRSLFILILLLTMFISVGFYLYISNAICAKNWIFFESGYFTITNPIFLFLFFILLLLTEFVGDYLCKKCNSNNSFISKIHTSLYRNTFKLRL